MYTFSLSTYEPRRNKFAFIRPSPPSGLCLEKTRCGAGLCLNSSTSNSTAILQQLQTNTFLLGAAWLPLTCRSWMTSPPGVTSSLLSGPVRETKTTTKKNQHTPSFRPSRCWQRQKPQIQITDPKCWMAWVELGQRIWVEWEDAFCLRKPFF